MTAPFVEEDIRMLRSRMNESDEFNKELIEAVKQICCKLEITPNFLKRESYWYALMDRWSKLRNPRQNWDEAYKLPRHLR